jgi:hypothetical protein
MKIERVKKIYVDLWALAERRGPNGKPTVHVSYTGMIGGEGGQFFFPKAPHNGRIEVARRFYDGDRGHEPHWHFNDGRLVTGRCLKRELLILAHEHGHARSYEEGHTTSGWDDTIATFRRAAAEKRSVTRQVYKTVSAEERRAWLYGRETLSALGWDDWSIFNRTRRRLLGTYERVRHD